MTAGGQVVVVKDLDKMIRHTAHKTYGPYANYVTRHDVEQELHLYVLENPRRFAKADVMETFRLLFNAARKYGLTQKAAAEGYSYDDIAWYTPARIAELLPLVRDPEFIGDAPVTDDSKVQAEPSDGKNLLVAVMDVRRAIDQVGWGDDTDEAWLRRLSDVLGGERPVAPGFRRGRKEAA